MRLQRQHIHRIRYIGRIQLHRVFLGNEHIIGDGQILHGQRCVVGQGNGVLQRETQIGQRTEETFRAGNAGQGGARRIRVQAAWCQRPFRMAQAIGQRGRAAAAEHGQRALPSRFGTVDIVQAALAQDHGIHLLQTRKRLAQAAVGQYIERAADMHRRKHGNFQIAVQRVMLQTVVRHHQLNIGKVLQQGGACRKTVGTHRHRRVCLAVQQQRLVARHRRRTFWTQDMDGLR